MIVSNLLGNNKKQFNMFVDAIKNCNDTAGDHIIWVDRNGNIHINCISMGLRWGQVLPQSAVKYYLSVKHAGNGYVGVDAASDIRQMLEDFYILVRAWNQNETGQVSEEDVLTPSNYHQINNAVQNYQMGAGMFQSNNRMSAVSAYLTTI